MASSALTTPGGTAAHDRKDGVLLNGSASLDIGRPCCFKPNCAVPASTSVTAPATVLYCTKRSTCGAILETIALLTCATEFDWADAERSAPLKNVAHLYRLAVEKTGAGVTTRLQKVDLSRSKRSLMTITEFTESDGRFDQPALRALWLAGGGEWEQAHEIAQSEETREGAWVHAYLHRTEGDTSNAGYWYRRAGRPAQTGDLRAEWAAIVLELLNQES